MTVAKNINYGSNRKNRRTWKGREAVMCFQRNQLWDVPAIESDLFKVLKENNNP